jgi:hypothetical protein
MNVDDHDETDGGGADHDCADVLVVVAAVFWAFAVADVVVVALSNTLTLL